MLSIQKTTFYVLFAFSVFVSFQSCTSPCTLPPYDEETTQVDTISKNDVKDLQNNLHQWMDLCKEKCPPIQEHNNVWFSIESLIGYLSYAQHVSSSMPTTGPAAPTISGIRLYFGKNANNELTVVASATYLNPTVTNRENDPDLGFGVLNYGNAGMPPKKYYPH